MNWKLKYHEYIITGNNILSFVFLKIKVNFFGKRLDVSYSLALLKWYYILLYILSRQTTGKKRPLFEVSRLRNNWSFFIPFVLNIRLPLVHCVKQGKLPVFIFLLLYSQQSVKRKHIQADVCMWFLLKCFIRVDGSKERKIYKLCNKLMWTP